MAYRKRKRRGKKEEEKYDEREFGNITRKERW